MDSSNSLRLGSGITKVYRDATSEEVIIHRSPSAPMGSIDPSTSVHSVCLIGTWYAVRR